MFLCANCTKLVMGFPAPSSPALLTPSELHELAVRLQRNALAICERFENDRLEGTGVPESVRCQSILSSVQRVSAFTLITMSKADILQTIETNLRRFEDPLRSMISSERTWPGHDRFVNTNGDDFDELEEEVEEIINHTSARLRVEDLSQEAVARTLVRSVEYSPASSSSTDTDREKHKMLRTLYHVSRQIFRLTGTYEQKCRENQCPS